MVSVLVLESIFTHPNLGSDTFSAAVLKKLCRGSGEVWIGKLPTGGSGITATPLTGPADVGTGTAEDERVKLSSLIEKLNERFGTDFTPADQLFFDQVQTDALRRDDLKLAATANNVDDFKLKFEKELEGLFIDRMEGNSSIFKRLMEDENFRNVASEWLTNEVYQRAREHKTHLAISRRARNKSQLPSDNTSSGARGLCRARGTGAQLSYADISHPATSGASRRRSKY